MQEVEPGHATNLKPGFHLRHNLLAAQPFFGHYYHRLQEEKMSIHFVLEIRWKHNLLIMLRKCWGLKLHPAAPQVRLATYFTLWYFADWAPYPCSGTPTLVLYPDQVRVCYPMFPTRHPSFQSLHPSNSIFTPMGIAWESVRVKLHCSPHKRGLPKSVIVTKQVAEVLETLID